MSPSGKPDFALLRRLLHDRDHPRPRVGRKITHAEFRADPAAAIQGDGVADYTQIVDEDGAVRMHIPHSYPVDDLDVGYAAAEALPALLDIAEAAAAYGAAYDAWQRAQSHWDSRRLQREADAALERLRAAVRTGGA